MKGFLFFLIAIIISACNNSGKKTAEEDKEKVPAAVTIPGNISAVKDPVTDTLMKLPFIIKSNNYIDSFSKHQHGIAFTSDTAEGVISVKAGYNGPERFETYYNFNIDIKTKEISIFDPAEGDYISLEQFLKNNQ